MREVPAQSLFRARAAGGTGIAMDDLPTPMPAATVIILRDAAARGGGAPELLMMQRARTMVFAAGAYVFPGGRVEADDALVAERQGLAPEDGAARVAAVREAIEECGIAVAVEPQPGAAALREWRRALHAELPFSTLLADAGARIEAGALTPYTHWLPPVRVPRRFDTRFFLALAPESAPDPTSDEAESVHCLWTTAADVLARHRDNQVDLLFPTMCTLERLAQFDSIDEILADAAAYPARRVEIEMVEEDGERWARAVPSLGFPPSARRRVVNGSF